MGALSFSPSPMTTVPFMPIVEIITRIALTATASAPFLSPRPTQRPAAMAAASVTRTSSRARVRSGRGEGGGALLSVMGGAYRSWRPTRVGLDGGLLHRQPDVPPGSQAQLHGRRRGHIRDQLGLPADQETHRVPVRGRAQDRAGAAV